MTLYKKAEKRVNAEKQLTKHKEFILFDWPEGDRHWDWVIKAPTNEIIDWVKSCLQLVGDKEQNPIKWEETPSVNLYSLIGNNLIERTEEFCGMSLKEIKTQWNGKSRKEILNDMNEMWPQDDCESLADAVYGLVE